VDVLIRRSSRLTAYPVWNPQAASTSCQRGRALPPGACQELHPSRRQGPSRRRPRPRCVMSGVLFHGCLLRPLLTDEPAGHYSNRQAAVPTHVFGALQMPSRRLPAAVDAAPKTFESAAGDVTSGPDSPCRPGCRDPRLEVGPLSAGIVSSTAARTCEITCPFASSHE